MKMTAQMWDALTSEERRRLTQLKTELATANRKEARRLVLAKGRYFPPKECTRCSATFTPTGARQEYCSPACRNPPKGVPHKVGPDHGEIRRRAWAEGRVTFTPKQCVECGTEFTPRSGQQKYCTKTCYNRVFLLRQYGLTPNEFDSLLQSQSGCCALCGAVKKGWNTGKGLHIDHCHHTGRVRGILCGDCNTALGRFGDDPVRLRAAADYLERT